MAMVVEAMEAMQDLGTWAVVMKEVKMVVAKGMAVKMEVMVAKEEKMAEDKEEVAKEVAKVVVGRVQQTAVLRRLLC